MNIKSTYCEASQCVAEKGVSNFTYPDLYCTILLQGDSLIHSNTVEYKLLQHHQKSTFFCRKNN